jgi:hypothetical protein
MIRPRDLAPYITPFMRFRKKQMILWLPDDAILFFERARAAADAGDLGECRAWLHARGPLPAQIPRAAPYTKELIAAVDWLE